MSMNSKDMFPLVTSTLSVPSGVKNLASLVFSGICHFKFTNSQTLKTLGATLNYLNIYTQFHVLFISSLNILLAYFLLSSSPYVDLVLDLHPINVGEMSAESEKKFKYKHYLKIGQQIHMLRELCGFEGVQPSFL